MVDLVAVPTPAGSSLKLGDLNNVAPAADSAAAGMLLGTTADGAWGPVPTPQWAGNLLSPGEADCAVPPTGRANVTSADIDPAGGIDGDAALIITAAGASPSVGYGGSNVRGVIPVTGGRTVTGQWSVRGLLAAAGARVKPRLYWWTAAGVNAPASQPMSEGLWVTLADTWAVAEVTAVAPPDARYASLWLTGTGFTAADTYAVDHAGVWAGAGGLWGPPGTPIESQGTRVRSPNGTDLLVEAWTGTAWTVVAYRSGVRTVPGGIGIRDGNTVTWTGTGEAPTGFRDTYQTGGKTYLTGDGIPTSLPGTPA
jgi:hypothetical protein